MARIFSTVLDMSLTACFVILAVLAVRFLLRKAPRRFSYILWAVVLFRLLCPAALESPLSLLPAARPLALAEQAAGTKAPVQAPVGAGADLPTINQTGTNPTGTNPIGAGPTVTNPTGANPTGAGPIGTGPVSPALTVPEGARPSPAPAAKPDPMAVAAAVWLCGAAAMAGYSAVSLLRLRRRLVGAVPAGDGVWLADHIPTPFVLGLLRPRVYLPSDLPEAERDYILLHERTHIRRFDHIVKALAWLALTVHWFNPLAWLAFRLAGRDMEMSCDEAVLRKMDRDVRADYSSSLLRLSAGRRLPAGPLAFGDGDPKGRIRHVMNYKKPALWVVVLALAVVLAACSALATDPAGESDASPAPVDLSDLTADLEFRPSEDGEDQLLPNIRLLGSVNGHEMGRDAFSGDRIFWWPRYNTDRYPLGMLSFPRCNADYSRNYADYGLLNACWADESRTAVRLDNWFLATISSQHDQKWFDLTVALSGQGGSVTERNVHGSAGTFTELSDEEAVALARLAAKLLTAAEDYYNNSGLDWSVPPAELLLDYEHTDTPGESSEFELPEYPGVTFRCTGYDLTAQENGETAELFTGMPICQLYLCDLNGDGRRELCSTVSFGSGFIDERIRVYDYANGKQYELADRFNYDYSLTLVDGRLQVGRISIPAPGVSKADKAAVGWLALQGGELVMTDVQEMDCDQYLARRSSAQSKAQWDEVLAPYAPFGLTWEFDDPDLDGNGLTMWFDGKVVRGIMDYEAQTWITEHIGTGFPEGAIELIAVYTNGELSGLRPATAEEQAQFDQTRQENGARAERTEFTGKLTFEMDDTPYSEKWDYGFTVRGVEAAELTWYPPGRWSELGKDWEGFVMNWGLLKLENPAFLGGYFADAKVFGTALWADEDHSAVHVDLFRRGASEFKISWEATLADGAVRFRTLNNVPEDEAALLTDEALSAAGLSLAQIMTEAERYWYDFSDPTCAYPVAPADSLPFTAPLEMAFLSGAGGWSTDIILDPDGSFTGEYSDSDMGGSPPTRYVCQFHGRFGDFTQLSDNSWSLTLKELVLDTGHPVDEEWIEKVGGYNIRFVSSDPYGFDSGDGGPLEPGAKFMLYAPAAKGYAPGDELYGANSGNEDYNSIMYQFWHWWPDRRDWTPGSTLGCWGLCNMQTGQGFFTENVFSWEEERAEHTGQPGVKESGFVHSEPYDMDALPTVEYVAQEVTVDYDRVAQYYDPEAHINKFVFYKLNAAGGDQTVYMTNYGETKLIVYGE